MSARWFYNAPISKVLFYASALTSLIHVRSGVPSSKFQLWRLIANQIPFSSTSEMIFGLSYLYELRKFERMMGTPKFSIFMLFISSFSTTLVATFSLMFNVNVAPGPYSIIYAYLVLHHAFIPVVKPNVMSFFGVNLSDKVFVYLMAIPLLFSNGLSSILPAVCGIFSGSLYTSNLANLQSWRLPAFLENMVTSIGPYIAGNPPPISPPQRNRAGARPPTHQPQRNYPGNGSEDSNMAAFLRQSATPATPLPPPAEDDITNLMGMGFDRDTVVAALISSGNSVQIAADRLLSGAS